jgi:hypothetical protein
MNQILLFYYGRYTSRGARMMTIRRGAQTSRRCLRVENIPASQALASAPFRHLH